MFINSLTNHEKQLLIKPSKVESKIISIYTNNRLVNVDKHDKKSTKDNIIFCMSITKYDIETLSNRTINQLLTHN